MTREEYDEVLSKINTLIVPAHAETTINGTRMAQRDPLHTFTAPLPTEISDDDGNLKKTIRKTTIEVHVLQHNETPAIYEMGIPVVDTEDKWHVNIGQKVPLNFNRDNVTPAYLRTIRTLVFNEMHKAIEPEDATHTWVREATSDERCTTEAMKTAVTHRFGEKAVAFDPGDPEANKLAVSRGYTVIPGRSLNKDEWSNIKRAQQAGVSVALPAGRVTPSPKPFHPDGKPLKTLPEEKYTEGIKKFIEYAQWIAVNLINTHISVVIANDRDWKFGAAYGTGRLTVNVARVGYNWFDQVSSLSMNALLIHEFAHKYSGDHLSSAYHDALCDLGAKLVRLAAGNPDKFRKHEV
jgi:hypothetical protein